MHAIDELMKTRKPVAVCICLVLLFGIGLIDYLIGYRISLIVLYVLPIGFATIYVGRIFASILAISSVVIWIAGDLLAGAPYPGVAIQLWNGGIVLSLFLVVVFLLYALRQALDGLEAKVKDRTEALRREMTERKRLEFDILNLTERERQQFGQELHDVVCQELTSITIAGHLVNKKLAAKGIEEAKDVQEMTEMVDRALSKARSVAGGFFTAGFDVEGLAEALRETARNIEERSDVKCEVSWQKHLTIWNEDVVMHLFRIAQEAMQNAIKHAEPSRIEVSLKETTEETIQLRIEDNGNGFRSSEKANTGLGLRIMEYRAGLIGGDLTIENPSIGGTRVICVVPLKNISKESTLAR